MNLEDEILGLFDEYFKNASKEELNEDLLKINKLGFSGISFERYLSSLNDATSFNFHEVGLCDDIEYASMYNKLFERIELIDETSIGLSRVHNVNDVAFADVYSMTESNYNMAA